MQKDTTQRGVITLTKTENTDYLCFKPVTSDSLPEIARILHRYSGSRTCDYTVGGIFMWIDYFKYRYCIIQDTLFIMGDLENHQGTPGFSLPVGKLPIRKAISMLREYCDRTGTPLRFSAIPEDRLADFRSVGLSDTEELTDWADYLYDASALATLSGKKLSKKRNHVNRFIADNPEYTVTDIHSADIPELKVAFTSWLRPEDVEMASAAEEHRQVYEVLDNLEDYPFEGIVLRDGENNIAGFTIGEVIGDTLYVHIEKINKDTAGAGETINKLFVEKIMKERPEVMNVNREEDTGDPGLRRAKESYHPSMMLRKYNISL